MNKDFAILFHTYSHKIFFYLFLATFIVHIFFSYKTQNIKPEYNLIPELPSKYALKTFAFGDDEFLFRIFSTRIQNAGDVFAGFVSLKYYDYTKLYGWFMTLDELNYHSNLTPSLAAYVYSNTQNEEDLRLITNYLQNHAEKDLDKNWWWLFQAIYLANNVLKDDALALKLAYRLSENNAQNAPLWTKQMPAFIHAKQGNGCMAFKIITNIISDVEKNKTKISVEEMNFMRYFINSRLAKLKNQKFNPKNCTN